VVPLVRQRLEREGIEHESIAGSMSQPKRHTSMMRFAGERTCRAFVLTLKAAAVGLNLTCANHVYFLEPSMDIAQEKQAVGRVHRVGQTRAVVVHRLVQARTVEEEVLAMNFELERKSRGHGQTSEAAQQNVADAIGRAVSSEDYDQAVIEAERRDRFNHI